MMEKIIQKMTITKDKFLTREDRIVYRDITRLTQRETDIFWLYVGGMSQREIANADEDKTYYNVTSAMSAIRKKFGVRESHHLICTVLPAIIRQECGEFLFGEIDEKRQEAKSHVQQNLYNV